VDLKILLSIFIFLLPIVASSKVITLDICELINASDSVITGDIIGDSKNNKTRILEINSKGKLLKFVTINPLVGSREDVGNLKSLRVSLFVTPFNKVNRASELKIVKYPWGVFIHGKDPYFGAPVKIHSKRNLQFDVEEALSRLASEQRCLKAKN
jgi:hypothetical protein